MMELLKEIQKECEAITDLEYVEIEYDGKYCPEFIDVRVYDEGFIADMILNRLLLNSKVMSVWNADVGYTVDVPSDDEVRFGFCDHRFYRISIDLVEGFCDGGCEVVLQVGGL